MQVRLVLDPIFNSLKAANMMVL